MEQQIKVWAEEEAKRQGVCVTTIHRWKARGRFAHLTFRKEREKLGWVSGEPKFLPPLKKGPPFRTKAGEARSHQT